MSVSNPSSAEFFEAKYQAAPDADPWKFASKDYELQRYRAILDALDGQRRLCAFEPGCSVGVLTEQLAERCDAVEACDFSATAVAAARARCEHLPNVTVTCEPLTVAAPWHRFDLIVLSEVGYYFTPTAWSELVATMAAGMQTGTTLLACHWLGSSPDHVQTGDQVHATLQQPLLERTLSNRHGEGNKGFRLERWTRKA